MHTDGLHHLLDGDVLEYGESRGVSNYMSGPAARVQVDEGEMLVVHIRLTLRSGIW